MPRLFRFGTEFHSMTSNLDHLDDLADWLAGLTSSEFTADLLIDRHSVPRAEAKRQAALAQPFYAIALQFLQQARTSSPETSFLPAYYFAMNLTKASIALTSLHQRVAGRAFHGLSYNPSAKSSQYLLTETIDVKVGGVFMTYWEAISGNSPPTLSPNATVCRLRMSSVYPYLTAISAEFEMVNRALVSLPLLGVDAKLESNNGSNWILTISKVGPLDTIGQFNGRSYPMLSGSYSGDKPAMRCFTIKAASLEEARMQALMQVPLWLLDGGVLAAAPLGVIGVGRMPHRMTGVQRPEELNWLAAFFHASNLVRYKPEFLFRAMDSRYWPLLLALRRHGLMRVLHLHLQFARQENIELVNPA